MAKEKEINQKTLKYRYLINLAISSVTRVVSLIFLMGRPRGIYLYFFYTFPVVFWMSSKFTFMGFLGIIYFQLSKASVHTIRTAINWVGVFSSTVIIIIVSLYVLFLLDTVLTGNHIILLLDVLKINMMCYMGLLLGTLYFSFHLYNLVYEI